MAWTAIGDDGLVGTASRYELRYATSPIDEGTWDSATLAADAPRPSNAGAAERMTEFVVLARRYPEAKLVFTGGQGSLVHGGTTEADVARRLFDALGVPEARVTYEDEARNTWENALLTRRLVEPKPGETWLLVTSASHMPRSVGAFRQAGWQVVPWPVNYRTGHGFAALYDAPFLDRLQMFESGLREWLGLVVYRALGRSDALFPAP